MTDRRQRPNRRRSQQVPEIIDLTDDLEVIEILSEDEDEVQVITFGEYTSQLGRACITEPWQEPHDATPERWKELMQLRVGVRFLCEFVFLRYKTSPTGLLVDQRGIWRSPVEGSYTRGA